MGVKRTISQRENEHVSVRGVDKGGRESEWHAVADPLCAPQELARLLERSSSASQVGLLPPHAALLNASNHMFLGPAPPPWRAACSMSSV